MTEDRLLHRLTVVWFTYDEAIEVAPPGSTGTSILLARASTSEQEAFIGRQTAVFEDLYGNFWDLVEMRH